MTESMRVSVLPEYTPEQAKKLNEVIDRKNHLEYLGLVLLKELNERFPLKQILKKGLVEYGYSKDETIEMIDEFFGDAKDENAGNCSAEGYTVDRLIREWQDTTNQMLHVASGRS